MDVTEILSIAADWSLAAVMAGVLIWVIRTTYARHDELIGRVLQVIEANTQALNEIEPALKEITRFMDAVERRLAGIEARLERMERSKHDTF
jgi:SpoVK/Ycf46/Vps4 family AAA+-type ATPase